MIFSRSKFEKRSEPVKSLVLALLPAPLAAMFAMAGDLPRGALVWTFSGALLVAVNAHAETNSYKKLMTPSGVLLVLHLPLVVWNPLRHAPFFGGIITPIAMVDYSVDYAFLWSWQKLFNRN